MPSSLGRKPDAAAPFVWGSGASWHASPVRVTKGRKDEAAHLARKEAR